MSKKDRIRLIVEITPEMKKGLDHAVSREVKTSHIPMTRSAVLRRLIDEYINQEGKR